MGWVVGCGTAPDAVSDGGCCPAAASGAGGVDGAGTGVNGDAGCGRESVAAEFAALAAAVLAPPPSDANLTGRCVFCPTTYPMANATANSSTTIKKPLSNCLLPTTSSNSPVSLFLMS